MRLDSRAYRILVRSYQAVYRRMQWLNYAAEHGVAPLHRAMVQAQAAVAQATKKVRAVPKRLPWLLQPLEPRVLMSISPSLAGLTVTFNQDASTSDGLYLRSNAGDLEYSTNGTSWSNDLDTGAGVQTLTLSGGVTINSHVAGGVHIETLLTGGGSFTLASDTDITIDASQILSTRNIGAGTNEDTAVSTGNSGLISIGGPNITVSTGAEVLAQVNTGSAFTAGTITLAAEDHIGAINTLLFNEKDTAASVTVSGTVDGGDVSMTSDANSSWIFSDSSTASNAAVGFFDSLSLLAGVAISTADSGITVNSGANIQAGNLTIHAQAETDAEVTALSLSTAIAVAVGQSDPSATVNIASGATINATGNADVTSNAQAELNINAKQNVLPSRSSIPVNVTLAVGTMDMTSTVASAGGLTVGGNLNVGADSSKNLTVTSAAGSYDDGMAGVGLAISTATVTTSATLGGTVTAGGDIGVVADNETSRNITAGSSQVGNGILAKLTFGITGAAGGAGSAIGSWFGSNAPTAKAKSGGSVPVALAGAVAYTDQTNTVSAVISASASVTSTNGRVDVLANSVDVPQIATVSMVDSAAFDETSNDSGFNKDNSIAVAVSFGSFTNNADAHIGNGATVNAANAVNVNATATLPQIDKWAQINGIDDITDKLNTNLGVQNGFFTSWAQSNATGETSTIAGSVDIITINNSATSYIDTGATVTQDRTGAAAFTFDPSSKISANTITTNATGDNDLHTGDAVVYTDGGGSDVGGLVNGTTYYVIRVSGTQIKLADSRDDALAGTALTITGTGATGSSHKITVKEGVFVTSDAETETLNLSGLASIGQLADILFTAVSLFKQVDTSQTASFGGVGGSYLGVTQNTNSTAQIKSGATVTGYAVHVLADTGNRDIAVAEAGGKGGKFAIFGSFAELDSTDNVLAQIDNGATVTANGASSPDPVFTDKNLLVHANDDAQLYTFAGGLAKGNSVGVGAAVAINDVTRNVTALIGDSGADTTPSGAISSAGLMGVDASGTGQIISAGLAGAFTSDEPPTPEPGEVESAPAAPGGGGGQFGISLSGDVALNDLTTDTEALVHDANITGAQGLDVTAADSSKILAVSGSMSISTSSGTSAGIAGSYTQNTETVTTKAHVDHSTLASIGAVDVNATGDENILSTAASGSASENGNGVAGQVSYNTITSDIEAGIVNGSSVTGASDVTVNALDDSVIFAIAGAVAYGGKSGIGASIVFNNVESLTQAVISGSDVTATGALAVTALGKRTIDAVAAAVGAGEGGMAAAVSIAINQIDTDTVTQRGVFAQISGEKTNGISAGGNITVSASNAVDHSAAPSQQVDSRDASILSVAGNISVSVGGSGVGLSYSNNQIGTHIEATVDNTTLTTSSGTVSVTANGADVIQSVAAGGTAADNSALAGSITLNSITDVVEAHASGSTVTGTGDVTISAVSGGTIESLAGTVLGGGDASVGAAAATNTITDTALSYISGGTVTSSGGSLNLGSTSSALIKSIAVTGSISGALTIAGSVSLNTIRNTIDSHITGSATASGQGGVNIASSDTSEADSLAGQVSIATDGAAVGAAVTTNDISNTNEAYVNSSTVNSSAGAVAISAGESGTIETTAAGGSGAELFAAGGSVTLNKLRNTVDAHVSGGASVTGQTGISITSGDTATLSSLAGNISIAIEGAAVGAAVSTNDIADTIEAYNDASTTNATTGNVTLSATTASNITSEAVGGSVAGGFAGQASVTLNKIRNTVDAHISGATQAQVGGPNGVSVTAGDDSSVNSIAGAVSIAVEGAAVGAAVATNDIASTIKAYIDNGSVNSGSGAVAVSAAEAGTINSVTAGGTGAGLVAAGGSVSLNQLASAVDAYIADASTVTGDTGVTLTGTDDPTIHSLAGQVTGAGEAAIGAALATNDIGDTVKARIEGSTVSSAAGSVSAMVTSSGEIKSLAAGISGAGTVAIGGSVSLNKIHKTLDAHISSSSTVTGAVNVTVSAADTSTMESLGGQIGGAGVAAIGASVAYNDIANTVNAYADSSTVTATAGSVSITANQGGTIQTISAGGNVSGFVSIGGSVAVNMMANTVQAYINGGTVTANNNVVLEATQTGSFDVKGGTINASLAVGAGATVVVNTTANTTEAYIQGATVMAEGNGAGASVPQWDPTTGVQSTDTVKGLSVIASTNESLTNYVFSASIGGDAVGVNVLTNVVGDTTKAYIDNSQINSASQMGGSVRVRAHEEVDESGASGALSGGGLGVGADVDTTLIKNTTQAYITDSDHVNRTTVNAADVEVNALTRENVTTLVGGAGLGLSEGAAGSSAGVVIQGTTEGYISEANVNSNGALKVLANDKVVATAKAGSLGVGLFAGGGGSIGLVAVGNTTKAHMDGVVSNAKGATIVEADSNTAATIRSGTGAGGGIAAVAGAIIVAPIANVTQAYIQAGSRNSSVNQTASFKTAGQTLDVRANDTASIDAGAGSLSVSLIAAGGASIAVPTIKNQVEAFIGSNTTASAQGEVTVEATSNRSITSNSVANAGAVGASINGAYSLAGIGTGIATDGAGLIVGVAATISNALSRSAGAPELPSDAEGQKAQTNSTTGSFSPTSGLSTSGGNNQTLAWIGSSSTVHSDADLLVKAVADISATVNAGGVTVGLITGVGGSTAEANISADTEAHIDSSATVTAGGKVEAIADGTGISSSVDAEAGSGGIVGLGASVGRSWINSTVKAFGDTGSTLTAGTALNIEALSATSTNTTSDANVGGVVSGADTEGDGFVTNVVKAYAGNNAALTAGTDATIYASSNNAITTNVTGGSGGLVGTGAAEATSRVDSYDTEAYLGSGVDVTAAGTFDLNAVNTETLNATSDQTVGGAVADNETSAVADVTSGLTQVEVGANSVVNADVISIVAQDLALSFNATSDASVPFDLAGTNTALTNADATTNANANLDSGATLNGGTSVTLKADVVSGQFISDAKTTTTGLTGTLTSTATSNKNTDATVTGSATATITTRSLIVESSVPYTQTDHYTKNADTNANTVTHLVAKVVGTVVTVVGEVICGWGLFCNPDTVTTDIIEYVNEVLGASVTATTPGTENMKNTVNFSSTVNIQGAGNPEMDVDSTGKITTMTGVTAKDQNGNALSQGETVTGDRIVLDPILNQTVGGVTISANNGETEGNSTINFDPDFDTVTIDNASTKQLFIGDIEVFNTTTPPAINHIASSTMKNWSYTLNTGASDTLVDIENTNATATDMTLQGHILNPGGTTKLYDKSGNIIDTDSDDNIITRLVDLKADGGTVGQADAPIYVQLPATGGAFTAGITEAVGDQGVNLDLTPIADEGIPGLAFTVNNVSSAHGDVTVNINDGLQLQTVQLTQLTLLDSSQVTGIALPTTWDPSTAVNDASGTISLGYPDSLVTGDSVTYFNGGGTSIGGLTNGRAYHVITVGDTSVQLGETFGAAAVSTANDTITFANDDDFQNGDQIVYSAGGGTVIGGLTDGGTYFVRVVNATTIQLVTSLADVGNSAAAVNLTTTGGAGQSLHFALDNSVATGVNHRLFADAYYIQSGNTVTKVDNSDIANVETGVATTAVATDTTLTIQNISAGGNVTITAGTTTLTHSDVILSGTISAGGTASFDAISGDISSTGSGQTISGQNIVLTAANGAIGTDAAHVQTNVDSGHINASAGGDVYLTETTGDMRVGFISSANGLVKLNATAGSIVDADNDAAADISADTIILTASGSIGSVGNALEIDPATLTATAGGDIVITATGGDLTVESVTSTGGNVVLTTLAGELDLEQVTASAGNVTLVSSNSITDLKNNGTADVVSNGVTLTAVGSVGSSSNDIDIQTTATGSLTADAGAGIYVNETSGALRVTHAIAGTGDVRLTVPETTGTGDDLTVLANGEVSSVGGTVTLRAGDNITVNSGALIKSQKATGTTINILGDYNNNDVAGTIITILGMLSGINVSILGNAQADTFNLDNVNEATGGTTTVLGAAGNDTFNVVPNASNPPTLNGAGATLVVDGQGGSDNYNFTIWGDGNSHIIALDHGTGVGDVNTMVVNGTDNADSFLLRKNFVAAIHGATAERIDYDTSMNGGLTINALGGDDYIAVDDNSTATHIFGGDGNDTVQIGQMFNSPRDVPQVAPGDQAATILTTKGYLTNGASYALDAHGGDGDDTFVMFHNTAAVSLFGDDGNDTFVVRAFILASTGQSDASQQVTNVNSGAGTNTINYALNAPVAIDGGSGNDKVIIVGTDANDTIVVTNQGVYGLGLFVQYTNVESLDIETGAGDDSIYVLSTMAGVETDIYGGTGNDHFYVGVAPPPAVYNMPLAFVGTAGIQGPLNLHGGESGNPVTTIPAPLMLPTETNPIQFTPNVTPPVNESLSVDTLNVDNTASTTNDAGTLTSTRLYGLGMGADTAINGIAYNGGITYDNLETIDVGLGSGNDTMSVLSVAAAATTVLRGNAGDDTFNITAPATNGQLVVYGDNAASTTFRGTPGNDTINAANSGINGIYYGGAGNDTILGGSGNDLIAGGSGDDTLGGGNGNDIIYGDAGFDVNINTDVVTVVTAGQPGVDNFNAPGNDTITDGTGNDVIFGDQGAVTQVGGLPNILTAGGVLQLAETANEALGGNDTITTGDGNKTIFGGAGSDAISTGNGNQVIVGDDGSATFGPNGTLLAITTRNDAVGAADSIHAGTGQQVIFGGLGGDTITTATDAATRIIVGDQGSATFTSTGILQTITTGTPGIGGADTISTGAGNNTIFGGTGSDTITTAGGNNVIVGDDGNATFAGDGTLQILTTSNVADGGNDQITAGGGNDIILGGSGSDIIHGGAGNDVILGDNGQIVFIAGSLAFITPSDSTTGGNDTLFGDAGDDIIIGETGADTIHGGDGNDTIAGDFASYVHVGPTPATFTSIFTGVNDGGAGDLIYGDAGDDDIIGGAGSDTIYGGDGNDDIIGGSNVPGASDTGDNLDGGAGDDVIAGDNASITRTGTTLSTLDRALSGTVLYDANGNSMVTSASQTNPLGSPERLITLYDQTSISPPTGVSGDDNIAGGAGNDMLFGEMGNDTIQGDGSISLNTVQTPIPGDINGDGVVDINDLAILSAHWQQHGTRAQGDLDGSGFIDINDLAILSANWQSTGAGLAPVFTTKPLTVSVEDFAGVGTDGNDYIEGNAGNDTIFGDLGQDDIIGGSSDLFGYATAAQRPDGSDTIYGGAGTRLAANDPGDTSANGHARDADTILGDNGDIFNITGTNGVGTGSYLTFNYDAFNTMKVIPRVVKLLDYTVGGSASDIGAADLIQGEAGDDTIYGQTGNDVLFGDGQDDNIIGGSGDDRIYGGTGDDGILGDDGLIFTSRNGFTEPLMGLTIANVQTTITADPGPDTGAVVYITEDLLKTVQLQAPTLGGNDLIYGGLGNDFIHGGAGDDAISGAEALPAFYNTLPVGAAFYAPYSATLDPTNPLGYNPTTRELAAYNPNNPRQEIANFFLNFAAYTSAANPDGTKIDDGKDNLFGDDGNDWIVGGTGHNRLFGGAGDDLLNADNNLDTNGGLNNKPDDATFADADFVYGGDGLDVLIANTGADRLFDWSGNFNTFVLPFDGPAGPTVNDGPPGPAPNTEAFLLELGMAGGADQTLIEPNGELGLFTQQDPQWNTNIGPPRDPPGNLPGVMRDTQGGPEDDAPVHTQAQTEAFALGTVIPDGSVLVWTDVNDTTQQSLYVYGTSGNDVITVNVPPGPPGPPPGPPGPNAVVVTLNGNTVASLPSGIFHVYVYAGEGNDTVTVQSSPPAPAGSPTVFVFGEDGNDTLQAQAGGAYLDGGNGNDTLIGGTGRNVLVGGAGSDTLTGGNDNDLLIGGILTYGEMLEAIVPIFYEWNAAAPNTATHIANLRIGAGLAAGYHLNALTVLDDGSQDVLNGGGGNNWIWGTALDSITLGHNDVLN